MQPLLEVRDLQTWFTTARGVVRVLDGVSFSVQPGEILGLVGETGSGKSVTAASILRLVRPPGRIVGGQVLFAGRDLLRLSEAEMRELRGRELAMVFQNPRAALNPLRRVGDVFAEVLHHRRGLAPAAAREEAARLLARVHVPDPERVLRAYPHQLSGGMCQRVMIAMAVGCRPRLLLADEPTSSLDVTTQAQIVDLLRELRGELGTAQILITHDLGLAAELCDRVAVMYSGRIVEVAPAEALFDAPRHPYTLGLMGSRPRLGEEPRAVLRVIPGNVPDPAGRPPGCAFHPRCAWAVDRCRREVPSPEGAGPDHAVACHRWREVTPA